MKLQGSELSIKMHGADVALLQQELIKLGFEIVEDEEKELVFGEATQKEVIGFQQQNGLKETGVVDEETAIAINHLLEAATSEFVLESKVVSCRSRGLRMKQKS